MGETVEREPEKRTGVERSGSGVLALATKVLMDVMFCGAVLLTASLPLTVRLAGKLAFVQERYPQIIEQYAMVVILYFVLGIAASIILWELRKMFRTVLARDCFVDANVRSLDRMGNVAFFIALMCVVRCIVYVSIAIMVVFLVFALAGLFCKVLAEVFAEAVRYKEENDLTI